MNILETLIANSQRALADGVYDNVTPHKTSRTNLVDSIRRSEHAPVISEVKFASPSEGEILSGADAADVAQQMTDGGAVALSVLTQPHMFGGSPQNLARVREAVDIPILMKDIIIDERQLDAAAILGADYILLIESVFGPDDKHARDALVDAAHSRNLGVILESHTSAEFASAVNTSADILGINNRNLDTLEVSLDVTREIMADAPKCGVPVISESGINSPSDICRMREYGADAFLVGTSVMRSGRIAEAVRSLVMAL